MEFFGALIELFADKILNFITKYIPMPKAKNKYLNGIITVIYWCAIGFVVVFLLIGIFYLLIFLIGLIIAWAETK